MKTLITVPSTELVVSINLAKQHLRLDTDDGTDDDLIKHLIEVATERAEHQLGRSLLTKTYKTIAQNLGSINLIPNLINLLSVEATDESGVTIVLTDSDYYLRESNLVPKLLPKEFIEKTIAVTYTAGYGTTDNIPKAIKQWILVDLATLYENREAVMSYGVNAVPYAFVDGLLDPYRVQY